MKAAAADIRGTAEDVRRSPVGKSETLLCHWHIDSTSPACQSILIKLLPFLSSLFKKQRNDTSVSDCFDSQ